ncbi:hypothetical protein [Bacillus sp. JJ1474]|uniref:YqgU-like beta propeller domain-containing protein n=1 Tax=Bacillus sp. JJ1474 TaxID=3122955 RepID=UPI002FFF5E35
MIQKFKSTGILFYLLCFFLLFLLVGCQSEKETGIQPIQKHSQSLHKAAIPHSFLLNEVQAPVPIQKGQFNSINGWLNNDTIIYMTNVELGTNIYTYNIITGETHLIMESEAPVSSVMASPSGNQVLIHSAPNSYEGIISIVDTKGKEILNKRISAFEIHFEWNPYDEDKILISSFTEGWDYSIYLLSIKDKTLDEIENKEPFVYWFAKDEIIYLNWSQNDLSLFAPLVKRNINEPNEKFLLNEIYYIKTIKDLLMTITVNSENSNEAEYTFFSKELERLASISVPHLTRFSDWLVPYFDFDQNHRFISLQPLFSTDADTYTNGFQLISFDIVNGDKKVIIDNMKNEPLSCAPSGDKCLYGFYFEKLINLETKTIIPLVKDY